ncbi:MAG: holo-ACP synthase [Bacteroidia bacterium]|nr:holo-ACP synthase [Bacteroidia bacterium]
MIFGIGIDVIEVTRIHKEIGREGGLTGKVFTPAETEYCEKKRNKAQHFAARYTAKEAFFKALGTGWRDGMRFSEIEVYNNELGRPEIRVTGKVRDFCEHAGITGMHLTMSHISQLAMAFVILEC